MFYMRVCIACSRLTLPETALDAKHERDVRFMGKYDVLGGVHRRSGGQGIVQFAEGPSRQAVALKVRSFFFPYAFLYHLLTAHTARLWHTCL